MAQTLQRQIVSRARALIADEVIWTSKALARDSKGTVCEWDDARATKFCALGALVRAASEVIPDDYVAHSFAMEAARQILVSKPLDRILSADAERQRGARLYSQCSIAHLIRRKMCSRRSPGWDRIFLRGRVFL